MVPWLPSDTAARALVDIALSASPPSSSYNMVHPRRISWSQLNKYFQRSLARVLGKAVPLVSFEEWIARLETVACSMTAACSVTVNGQRSAVSGEPLTLFDMSRLHRTACIALRVLTSTRVLTSSRVLTSTLLSPASRSSRPSAV